MENQSAGIIVVITLVYEKCSQIKIMLLLDSLGSLNDSMNEASLVGEDFNVIRNIKEKLGGLPVTFEEIIDFSHCISTCNLDEIPFKGSKFTWWNDRTDGDCILRRLHRVLSNDKLHEIFPITKVENLVRSGSDHALLIKCNTQ